MGPGRLRGFHAIRSARRSIRSRNPTAMQWSCTFRTICRAWPLWSQSTAIACTICSGAGSAGELRGTIALVISNHPRSAARCRAIRCSIPSVFDHARDKASAESLQLELLKRERVNLIVLARYMQILSEQFVSDYPRRIINIHHSFCRPLWVHIHITRRTSAE